MGKISTEEIIRRCKIKHGDKYDYSETKYMGDSIKMTVICPQHGYFLINAHKHYKDGRGCKECGYIKMAENRRSRIIKERYKDIVQPEDYKILVLTKGKISKVDNEDFDRLKNICWKISTDGYGEHTSIGELSRYIMNAPEHLHVDHENGDPLDNRKQNLRLCTRSDNQCNRTVVRGRSKYKGVQFIKKTGKWSASISKAGMRKRIGTYDTEVEAAIAYNEYAKHYHGEFAKLNEIIYAREEENLQSK